MKHIRTTNLNITSDECKALDRAVFSSTPAPERIIQKHALYVAELKDKLTEIAPSMKIKSDCAYNLWCWIERIQIDEGNHICERMNANAHTAHEQLKNWK